MIFMEGLSEKDKERVRAQLQFLSDSLSERYRVLPLIASLSAAILAILTINVLPLTLLVRILLAILLLSIPIILWLYLNELRDKHNAAKEILIGIFEENNQPEMKKRINQHYGVSLKGFLPEISVIFLGIVILVISILIFCTSCA